jgi:hypothetical protein
MVALKSTPQNQDGSLGLSKKLTTTSCKKMIKLKIPKKEAGLVTENDLSNEEMI